MFQCDLYLNRSKGGVLEEAYEHIRKFAVFGTSNNLMIFFEGEK
jgi:hypothetical protein